MQEHKYYPRTTDFHWDGLGGTLTASDGQTHYIQGEDASQLYDQIEECVTQEQIESILSQYDTLWEATNNE